MASEFEKATSLIWKKFSSLGSNVLKQGKNLQAESFYKLKQRRSGASSKNTLIRQSQNSVLDGYGGQ
jgi:hypothetical protein